MMGRFEVFLGRNEVTGPAWVEVDGAGRRLFLFGGPVVAGRLERTLFLSMYVHVCQSPFRRGSRGGRWLLLWMFTRKKACVPKPTRGVAVPM